MTSRAFVENVIRGWCNRYNVCRHKEGCGENKKCDESLCGKHFLFVFGQQGGWGKGSGSGNLERLYIYRFFCFVFKGVCMRGGSEIYIAG